MSHGPMGRPSKEEKTWQASLRGPDVFAKPRSRASSQERHAQEMQQPFLLHAAASEVLSVPSTPQGENLLNFPIPSLTMPSPFPSPKVMLQPSLYEFNFDWQARDRCPPRHPRGPNFVVAAPTPVRDEKLDNLELQINSQIFMETVGPLARLCAEVTNVDVRRNQILPKLNVILDFAARHKNQAEILSAIAYVKSLMEEERKFLVKKRVIVNENSLKDFINNPETARDLDELLRRMQMEVVKNENVVISERIRRHYGNWQFWWSMGLLILTLVSALGAGFSVLTSQDYKENYKVVWEFIKTLGKEGEFRFDNPSLISLLTGLGTMLLGLAAMEWKKQNALQRAPKVIKDLLSRGKTLATLDAILQQLSKPRQTTAHQELLLASAYPGPNVTQDDLFNVDPAGTAAASSSPQGDIIISCAIASLPSPVPQPRVPPPGFVMPIAFPGLPPPPSPTHSGIPSATAARAAARLQRANSRSRTPSPHQRVHTDTPSRSHTPGRSRPGSQSGGMQV